MYIRNADPGHPRHNYDLFLPSRPYRGELPTVAGFLLYPDTPSKMETTTGEAFCFRPPRQDSGKEEHIGQKSTQQETQRSHHTSSRQKTGGGNGSSRDRKPGHDDPESSHHPKGATAGGQNAKGVMEMMQSQYQTDFFPPPSSCHRRRTPAPPQADNLGINPAFRIEFSTVQRETYPGWPIINRRESGRLRMASNIHDFNT